MFQREVNETKHTTAESSAVLFDVFRSGQYNFDQRNTRVQLVPISPQVNDDGVDVGEI